MAFRLAPENELFHPFLQGCPFEENAAIAYEAAEADVGAQAGYLPVTPAAGMSLTQADDIAKIDFKSRASHLQLARARADAD